ncbi:MAG: hypothetical protein ACPGVI_03190, partial [Crocinitomicaceae bacterium]
MNLFSDISLYWLIPFGILCIAIAFLYYRGQLKEVKKSLKISLVALRAFALFLLGLLLFGIIYEKKETKSEKPVFVTMIDNSSSMLNYKDSSEILQEINKTQNALFDQYSDKFEFRTYHVGSDVQVDSTNLSAEVSNLDKGFDFLYNEYYNRNVGGICFISDGNFNQGSNPIYAANKINLTPIFTLGVGDTIVKKDHLIRNVNTNDIAFFRNQFPIEVQVESQKMKGVKTEVSLWQGESLVDTKNIIYSNDDSDFQTVVFNVNANSIGFQNYTVRLKNESNESSFENNKRTVFVEVIDSRSKILMVARAPHPDLTAIKQVLDQDENVDVESILLSDWDGKTDGVSLIVWHNPVENGRSLKQAINKNNIPCLYLLGLNSNSVFVNGLNLGSKLPQTKSIDQVQGSINDAFQLFEVSESLNKNVKKWQPLSVPFGNYNFNGGDVLIKQKIGPVVKDAPVLYFNSNNGKKSGVLIGEGLWKWRLSEYLANGNVNSFTELVQKTTQYLTVKTNTDPLRINLPKRISSNRSMIFNAEFYNSAFERITEPVINLVLTNDRKVSTDYTFSSGANDYTLDVGQLQEGVYTWEAETVNNGKKYKK